MYYSKPTLSGYLDSLGDSVEYPNLIQTEQVQEQQEQILQIADDALTAIKELDTLIAASDKSQVLSISKGKGNAPCAELTHALARGTAHGALPPLV